MSDAVTGFHSTRVALADDVAIAIEGDGHGFAGGILGKQYMATQITFADSVSQFGGWLEDTWFRCVDVGLGYRNVQDLWFRQIGR